MDLLPDDTEEAIRAASADFLRDRVPLAEARARPAGLWKDMAALGWLGIAMPEADGGLGLGHGCEALVFVELGRHLAPLGVLASALGASIAAAAGDGALAAAIVSGDCRLGLALSGQDGLRVVEAQDADGFVRIDAAVGAIHGRPAAGWKVERCLDPSTSQARIVDVGAPLAAVRGERSALHQQIAAAAFALGAAEAARDMAAGYAATREQFGRPIGAFQGIKHPCADMAVRASAARAQLLYAGLALDAQDPRSRFEAAAAKMLADDAGIENARMNVQVHGGIGMTDEAAVHLVLKRAHLLRFIAPVNPRALLD